MIKEVVQALVDVTNGRDGKGDCKEDGSSLVRGVDVETTRNCREDFVSLRSCKS
jgi:hypothetical protein